MPASTSSNTCFLTWIDCFDEEKLGEADGIEALHTMPLGPLPSALLGQGYILSDSQNNNRSLDRYNHFEVIVNWKVTSAERSRQLLSDIK